MQGNYIVRHKQVVLNSQGPLNWLCPARNSPGFGGFIFYYFYSLCTKYFVYMRLNLSFKYVQFDRTYLKNTESFQRNLFSAFCYEGYSLIPFQTQSRYVNSAKL